MKILTLLVSLMLLLTTCSNAPTAEQVEATVRARLTAAVPQVTNTSTPTFTATIPPASPTPKPTNTPRPTSTPQQPTSTPTPLPVGLFSNPAPISTTVVVEDEIKTSKMGFTVLEVRRGDAALKLARAVPSYFFEYPIEDQEYLAIKAKFDVMFVSGNDTFSMYTHWHLTLRSSDGGNDLWSVRQMDPLKEAYAPYSAEGWVFFLVRQNADLLLYFQPNLLISQEYGDRESGAYFSIAE